MPENRQNNSPQKSWAEQHRECDGLAAKARKIAFAGYAIIIGTCVTNALDTDISRSDALGYAVAMYAGTYLRCRLANDFMDASFNTKNPRPQLHNAISRPLHGIGGKFALAAAFVTAYITAGTAAENEQRVAVERKYEDEARNAPAIGIFDPIKKNGQPAGLFCRGEETKIVAIDGELHKLVCAGVNMDPALRR